MMNFIRQHPFSLITFIVVIILLFWGFQPRPVTVSTSAVKIAPLSVTVNEEGRTRLVDRFVISAPIDGVVCRENLEVGDTVQKDQTLVTIAPPASQSLDARSRSEAKARVAAAQSAHRAALEQARAAETASQLADTELARLQQLVDKKLIAPDQYDRANAEARRAEASLRSANFNVDVAKHELQAAKSLLEISDPSNGLAVQERIPIRSPITGKVLKIEHECDTPVRTGELLLEIGDPSALEIEVDVLSSDAVRIRPGIKVYFNRWGGDKPLEGIVRTIEPIAFTKVSSLGVEEQRVLIICDISSPAEQWRRLGDGYRVDAQFVLWEEQEILQIPTSSLFKVDQDWAVFVVDNNRAKRKRVTIGQRSGLTAQVLDGLDEGERVLDHIKENIDDGTRINPLNAEQKHP